jgi:Protein phosphatase inhibitor 2 (IPP-2)
LNIFNVGNEPESEVDACHSSGGICASSLAARLKSEQSRPSDHVKLAHVLSLSEEDNEMDESEMSPEEREKRREFKEHRKKHYNEYEMAQKAKELLRKEGLYSDATDNGSKLDHSQVSL